MINRLLTLQDMQKCPFRIKTKTDIDIKYDVFKKVLFRISNVKYRRLTIDVTELGVKIEHIMLLAFHFFTFLGM